MRRSMKRLKTFKQIRPTEGPSTSDANAIPLESIGGKIHIHVTFSFAILFSYFVFGIVLIIFLFPFSRFACYICVYSFYRISFLGFVHILCYFVFGLLHRKKNTSYIIHLNETKK